MDVLEGRINIKEAFGCRNCKTLAQQQNINQCCQLIICTNCINRNTICPKCRNQAKYLKSNMLQQMSKYVFLSCPFDCKTTLSYFQYHKHKLVCPEATIECPYCKKTPKVRLIPEHMGEDHIQECNRMLNDFQKLNEVKSMQIEAKQIPVANKIQPFKHGTTGEFNIEPRISKIGRIVCGRVLPQVQLPGQLPFGTNSLFQRPKQVCSIQYGSCDRCMDLDVDRLGLPKTYLLNLQGRICCYLPQKRKVACGCLVGKICNEQVQCVSCRRTLDLVERGFYKKCL